MAVIIKKIFRPFLLLFSFFSLIMNRAEWSYIYYMYRKKYCISSSVSFIGKNIIFEGDGEIIIGNHSHIARNSWLSSYNKDKIIIGKNCRIGQNVVMVTNNTIADQDFSKTMDFSSEDIVLGDYVWVGCNVFIKEGVTIGDNSVIGANSVVTKSVPSNCKVLGATIVKKNI